MNPLIIVPTFVSVHRRSNGKNLASTYDHTTQLSDPGELPRLLESLSRVEGACNVAVLVSSDRAIEDQAAEKVQVIAAQYPQLNVLVVGGNEFQLIQQRIDQLGAGRLSREISLQGYGAIRNLGLVVADSLGFDSVVFLDDDVVIEDPDFMRKAVYGLGKLTRKGIPILVKTGFYYNAQGQYLSSKASAWYNRSWDQSKAFNAMMENAMRGPRLSRANFACGGCLAIHREAFKRVAFDPWVMRGEDLDYLLNLRMYGADVWFDNQWSLKHLPPRGGISAGLRFTMDVYRWMYEFRKLEFSRSQIDLLQVKPENMEPYPGPFLNPKNARRLRRAARLSSLFAKDRRDYRRAAKAAKGEAAQYAERNCSKYFELQYVWNEVMNRLENDQIIQTAMMQSIQWRQSSANSLAQQVKDKYTGAFSLSKQAQLDPGATGEINLNLAE